MEAQLIDAGCATSTLDLHYIRPSVESMTSELEMAIDDMYQR